MKILTIIASLFFAQFAVASTTKIDLFQVSVSQAVHILYSELSDQNYVIAPELVQDERPVTFRYASDKKSIKSFIRSFLSGMGYDVKEEAGTHFISKGSANHSTGDLFVYSPKYRNANYLIRQSTGLFTGSFLNSRAIDAPAGTEIQNNVKPDSAAGLIQTASDKVIFRGAKSEIAQLAELLKKIDTFSEDLLVKGYIFEVSGSTREASGISLLMNFLNQKVGLSITSATSGKDITATLNTGSLSAILEATNEDSRFKLLSSPVLRVSNGDRAKFTVGDEVPTLGSVISQNGQSTQSIDYRPSGLIFDVTGSSYEDIIHLTINQQMSNFQRTETGVNGTPTLTKRSIETKVSLNENELIILGSLTDKKESEKRSSFLNFLKAKDNSTSSSEIVLILTAEKVKS